MLNRIILIGRLVRDPELRYTQNGTPVARFTLAVDRGRSKTAGGEKETDFIDIVVWQKQAEVCTNFLGKGRLVAVEGRLQVRNYETKEGEKRRAAEVVAMQVKFLDRGPGKEKTGGGFDGFDNFPEDEDSHEDAPF